MGGGGGYVDKWGMEEVEMLLVSLRLNCRF